MDWTTRLTITDVDYLYSDGHSLLSCTIDIATHVNTSQENIDVEQNCNSSKPRWNKTNEPDFVHNIDRNLVKMSKVNSKISLIRIFNKKKCLMK